MNESVKVICKVISGIVGSLILGEVLVGAVSRPIVAWRQKSNISKEKLSELLDIMNQRICDLEDILKGKEA